MCLIFTFHHETNQSPIAVEIDTVLLTDTNIWNFWLSCPMSKHTREKNSFHLSQREWSNSLSIRLWKPPMSLTPQKNANQWKMYRRGYICSSVLYICPPPPAPKDTWTKWRLSQLTAKCIPVCYRDSRPSRRIRKRNLGAWNTAAIWLEAETGIGWKTYPALCVS